MDINNLYQLIERLGQDKRIENIESVCETFCELSGFEFYLFGVCNASSLSAPEIFTLSNYPKIWYEAYFANEMQKRDPVVRYCFDHSAPITWNKLMEMSEYCDPIALQFMQSARESGLVDGLSIPVRSPSGQISILSLATNNAENVKQRLLNVLPLAQFFGYSIFETYLEMNLDKSLADNLTSREKESLFWACEGKTAWEMAKIMNISERTAIFHLTSVTKKLGAANRQHAVAKAILYGLVKPLP